MSNRSTTLGGEGWPAADVAKPFKNRKSRNASLAGSCKSVQERAGNVQKKWHTVDTAAFPIRCVHYVGFRDDRFWNAYRIFGGPRFIHRWWDKRAQREIAPNDIVIFADGDWRQEPRAFNAPDITETCSIDPRCMAGRPTAKKAGRHLSQLTLSGRDGTGPYCTALGTR